MKKINSLDEYKLCEWAAENEKLSLLKYLHKKGYYWDKNVTYCAATNGDLEMLQYAYENNCPWDEGTTANAVYGNHFEVLKWLHENGCPWDGSSWSNANENRNDEIIKYLTENNCPTEYLEDQEPNFLDLLHEKSIENIFVSQLKFHYYESEKQSIMEKQKRFLDLLDHANKNGFSWIGESDDLDFVDVNHQLYENQNHEIINQSKFLNFLHVLYDEEFYWVPNKNDIKLIKKLMLAGYQWNDDITFQSSQNYTNQKLKDHQDSWQL